MRIVSCEFLNVLPAWSLFYHLRRKTSSLQGGEDVNCSKKI